MKAADDAIAKWYSLKQELAEARDAVIAAKRWLLSHQRHDEDCAANPFRPGFKTRECDCGLDATIALLRGALFREQSVAATAPAPGPEQ